MESEDVGQEVFLSIFQQREQYDPSRGTVKGWILGFAHFKALVRRRYLRTRNFYAVDEIASLDELRLHPSWEFQGMSKPDWIGTVERGLATLTASQRRTIELVNFDGYTLQEASQILGEGLSNIKNHYYRGMRTLRVFLIQSGKAHPATDAAAEEASHGEPLWALSAQRTPRAGERTRG